MFIFILKIKSLLPKHKIFYSVKNYKLFTQITLFTLYTSQTTVENTNLQIYFMKDEATLIVSVTSSNVETFTPFYTNLYINSSFS